MRGRGTQPTKETWKRRGGMTTGGGRGVWMVLCLVIILIDVACIGRPRILCAPNLILFFKVYVIRL